MSIMYDFIKELEPLMKKHNIKSITPIMNDAYIGFQEDGKFFVYGNHFMDMSGDLKNKVHCEHKNKAFSNFSFASNPPQTPWICKDCGYEGVHRGREESNDYQLFKEKFKIK